MEDFDENIVTLQNNIGYNFTDPLLLTNALSHSSYVNEKGLPANESNERLEFLGDSVIELIVSHALFDYFPQVQEGELTRFRASLVRGATLAKAALAVGLDRVILVGRGEEITGGRQKRSILAGAFEALIGALYLDGGFEEASRVVVSVLGKVKGSFKEHEPFDFKSILQELSVKHTGHVPEYYVSHEGPDHERIYYSTVDVAGKRFGPVKGASKKEAEQRVARAALKGLGWIEEEE
ncbi:MAG: ribonuclease III [Actinomycetota bacterium]|nr:ribonuclease III [Actinomycetota bacterium]